ncbi:[citrate (pro-3S)-lyase] ligase [Limosilactobacillus albertensis]|uniref:[Citrate [pro-3S]-lyase] ligase n=1 Tax=Limosilactobacillus albertensis TaxID=2759752 RepID=A0A839GZP9_9LACO|nr:[citrate (pro-3S)-lyase] ligase [Limosilactobacillus albertensis]MBB1123673.1 [citrate (pro-3S)-lyase] ligase [Limosilactobacillus albertensis]MCD7121545.1 [citrate (pro-3S)-lyase] ligase [Limosilactobacillus albertensis]
MQVREINIHLKRNFTKWKKFLQFNEIQVFSEKETASIDKTFVWEENGEILATGSIAGNVLKYIAICSKIQGHGETFNSLVSKLENEAAMMGRFHLFVFTKPQYSQSFQYVGFHELAKVDQGAILESGTSDVHDYISSLPHFDDQDNSKIAGIVMNANPFTKGHRFLIEKAGKENDHVYVFVVSEDVSSFSFAERYELVKAGTRDLPNVTIVSGKEYMVSYATFPAYFLKDDQNVGRFQASLDGTLFKEQIAKPLNITSRYLGKEPYSKTTDVYNEELSRVLPPDVEVKIIDRKQAEDQDIISATKVRAAIANDNIALVKKYVPDTTLEFIKNNWSELQTRIKEGSIK